MRAPMRYLSDLLARPFVRNVMTVAGGTAVAQGVWLIFIPLLTRLYDPAAMGAYGMFASIVAIAAPIAALGYPIALVLPESRKEAITLSLLSLSAALISSSIALVLIVILSENITAFFGSAALGNFLLLVPLAMFLSSLQQVAYNWSIRLERFHAIAKVAILQALFINVARCALAIFSPTAGSLIAIATAAPLVYARMLGGRLTNVIEAARQTKWSLAEMLRVARLHRDFPLYRAPQMMLSALSEGLPVLILGSVMGPAAAGFYALAALALQAPVSLIGKSVDNVFYPAFQASARQGDALAKTFLKVVGGLALTGLPLFAIVVIFGKPLFAFVFGAEWARAGEYATWLAVWLYFMLVNRPCIGATSVLKMQRIFLIHTIFTLAARAAALLVGVWYFSDALLAIALFSIVGGLSCLSLIALVILKIQHRQPQDDLL